MDGVVGRNSGESSSRIGRRKGRGRKGPLSWPKQALIYTAGRASVGRSGNALPGSEPMGAYVTCRWLDSPPSSPPLVNCGGFEYFARTSTLSLHVPRLTPISYARSISSCVAFYTHSIRKPFFAPVPLHLHVHSCIFARIGSIVSDRSRTCNGSRFGAARFEIFLVYRLDEEREREREVNEMHDFHNEIGRKGSASGRQKYRNVESNGSVNSRQVDGLRSARPSSGLSMNNFRRSSKVRMNRTRPADAFQVI